jgi:Arc/MetJ-type ribon-helix-helix transcriptional regulator
MKVSVSLPDEDVEFLDAYAQEQGIGSRSAVLHKAVRLLRAIELSEDYEAAWLDWGTSEDGRLWSTTTADGITG